MNRRLWRVLIALVLILTVPLAAGASSIIIEDTWDELGSGDTELTGVTDKADEFSAEPLERQGSVEDQSLNVYVPGGPPVNIVVTCGGDTTLGCTPNQRKSQDGFDSVIKEKGYSWSFSMLSDIFSTDDMTLVNFEGTLIESNKPTSKMFNFKGPAEYTSILTSGSIEAVNLANNHFIDYGDQGKNDTKAALDEAGITYCAPGLTAIYEVRGVKIGLIGNTFPYTNGKRDISKAVAKLRSDGCQIVIASFHWGSEYEVKFSRDQRSIGRAAIDAGADVVIGHHPHIIQGIEMYKGKYIIYSLGNLVFGGNTNPDDRDSFLARLTFTVAGDRTEPPTFEMIPIRVTELSKGTDYRPVVAYGEEAERIRSRVLKLSENIDVIEIAKLEAAEEIY